jgi:acetyl esterase/lipase
MTDIELALRPARPEGWDEPMRGVSYGVLARQKLDIYRPKAGARAIVLFIHGGGWVSGSRRHYKLLGHTLARRGFACVVPDYQLYPKSRFPSFVEDGARAFKWTHDHAVQIGGRRLPIFVMGHSAGAHIAALLALDPDYLRAHELSTDAIAGVIGLAGPYTLDPLKWPGVKDIFAASSAAPHSARPIKLVRAGAPPMLLLHGASDRVVKSDASVNLASALMQTGSQADAKVYPGIGHLGVLISFLWGLRWRASVLSDTQAFIADRLAR